MKKYLLLLLLLLTVQQGYCQKSYTVEQLFSEFSKAPNIETVKLGKFAMGLASIFTKTMGVKSVEVYSFDSCSRETKKKLTNAVKVLKDSSYDILMRVNDNGQHVRILTKIKDNYISELIVITLDPSGALIRLKGKIDPSKFEDVTHEYGNG
ncbi:MAG: DUF4252 domain-containing protein [Mediterranea sp.]|jgi:hypothetical protein|nr:DUF4252 domain-containing protein [Mediterranea sp.]